MTEIIACCGYRCDLCLAFQGNIENDQDRHKISDGWFKYFGFRIPPLEIGCDGCFPDKDHLKLTDDDCPVRPCVRQKGLKNCATCQSYICNKLESRIVDAAELAAENGQEIPEKDRQSFIRPYESKRILEQIRKENSTTISGKEE